MLYILSYCFDQYTFMSTQKANPNLGPRLLGGLAGPRWGRENGPALNGSISTHSSTWHVPMDTQVHRLHTHTHTHTHCLHSTAMLLLSMSTLHLGPLFLSPPTRLSPRASFLIVSIAS